MIAVFVVAYLGYITAIDVSMAREKGQKSVTCGLLVLYGCCVNSLVHHYNTGQKIPMH